MSNIERRIARLESLAKVMNEAEDFSEKEKVFTYLCKSCNLTDVFLEERLRLANLTCLHFIDVFKKEYV